tara:strand:+ start:257 stop:637 length:381 start_codon:yes stop_codon:yes gene_type:complete
MVSPPLTLEELAKAYSNINHEISTEDSKGLAEHVMSFFGYETYVIDNRLEPNDRDVFYMLEELGLLTTEREDVLLKRGPIWRIRYWKLNKQKVRTLAIKKPEQVVQTEIDEVKQTYEELDESVWIR